MVDGLDPIPVTDVTFKFEPKVTINPDAIETAHDGPFIAGLQAVGPIKIVMDWTPREQQVREWNDLCEKMRLGGEAVNASLRAIGPLLQDLYEKSKMDPQWAKIERGYIHYRRAYLRRGLRQHVSKRRSRAYR